jgi:hypothetical protein
MNKEKEMMHTSKEDLCIDKNLQAWELPEQIKMKFRPT